jgi:hypothetical protein
MKPAATISALLLTLIAVAHLARAALGIEVTAAGVEFPIWASLVGGFLIGGLALWLWREQSR